MRIAYTTTFDARDVQKWSGTPYHMSQAFTQAGIEVNYIGSLSRKLPPFFKLKQIAKKYLSGQRESPRFNIVAAKHYSKQVAEQLKKLSVDAIVSPLINPIAYLECKQPLVLWTDAVYSSLVGYNFAFLNHSASSIKQGNAMTAECLHRAKLAIFSSDWAARAAIELYGVNKEKVKVVPFGANLNYQPTLAEIQNAIKTRSRDTIKLLFLGKRWELKNGDLVLKVAKALHEAGHRVELNLVGCHPPQTEVIPSYIKPLGFISKHTEEGSAKIRQLLGESHFLFIPSRAEAYGIAFCEANAFGVPCLTSYVGGIATIVKDHVNGMTFALDTPVDTYCHYIVNLIQNYSRYEALALSAFHEYETRLNWKVAVEQVKKLISGVL